MGNLWPRVLFKTVPTKPFLSHGQVIAAVGTKTSNSVVISQRSDDNQASDDDETDESAQMRKEALKLRTKPEIGKRKLSV